MTDEEKIKLVNTMVSDLCAIWKLGIEKHLKELDEKDAINLGLATLADFRLAGVLDLIKSMAVPEDMCFESIYCSLMSKETFNLVSLVKQVTERVTKEDNAKETATV